MRTSRTLRTKFLGGLYFSRRSRALVVAESRPQTSNWGLVYLLELCPRAASTARVPRMRGALAAPRSHRGVFGLAYPQGAKKIGAFGAEPGIEPGTSRALMLACAARELRADPKQESYLYAGTFLRV